MEAEGDLEAEEPNLEIGRLKSDVLTSLQVKFSANSPRGKRSQIKYKVCINCV
jgi:hypothetical protein